MFTELPRETIFAQLRALEGCPPQTRMALVPTSNETCIGFHQDADSVSLFHRSVGGGTSVDYGLRSVVATRVQGAWLVVANVKSDCPAAARPERIALRPDALAPHHGSEVNPYHLAELQAARLAARQAKLAAYRARRAVRATRSVAEAAARGGASPSALRIARDAATRATQARRQAAQACQAAQVAAQGQAAQGPDHLYRDYRAADYAAASAALNLSDRSTKADQR